MDADDEEIVCRARIEFVGLIIKRAVELNWWVLPSSENDVLLT